VPTGVWTSGAGKAREPGGPISANSVVEGVERTPSKGQGQAQGPRVPHVVSAPPSASAPVPSEDTCIPVLTDAVNALSLDKEQL